MFKNLFKRLTSAGQFSLLISALLSSFADAESYKDRFLQLWGKIHNPDNGYFSPEGIPYHSIETMIIEAPDYGHETTSETFSYWLWLETMYGWATGDWSYLNRAWQKMETYCIPTLSDQPTNDSYNASNPATYAGEGATPDQYPALLESDVPVGQDPIANELELAYGTSTIYGMHWLLDTDNWYGFGKRGDGTSRPSYINTFQRGEQESVWEAVPHPSWEEFKWGGSNGYLDLFTKDNSYAKQWRYTNAPDADARAVQVLYWAYLFAKERNQDPLALLPINKVIKMGDYLRYCFFDKYFKPLGCQDKNAQGATGHESAHYLISWYYSWGGSCPDAQGSWAWRIGCSHVHFGYQNPVTAWILSTVDDFSPKSTHGKRDWDISFTRQLEFYQWLQSSEGAIAGGATNSYNGRYESYPTGTSTFYGMAYDNHPVYHDPGSNTWFGWQAWSMERMCELYYLTNDPTVERITTKWIEWVKQHINLPTDGSYSIPATLAWTGSPDPWTGSATANANLHVTVEDYTQDVGVTGCLAKALIYYAAATKKHGTFDTDARDIAKALLDRAWTNYSDSKGVAAPETRGDYSRMFEQEVHIPSGWQGTMPNGESIQPGNNFIDIRGKYRGDPDYMRVKAAYDRGRDPVFTYHRFWAQADIATAMAEYARLIEHENPLSLHSTRTSTNRVSTNIVIHRLPEKWIIPVSIDGSFSLSVHTLGGQLVALKKGTAPSTITIEKDTFPMGVYILSIKHDTQPVQYKLLTKHD